MTVEPENSPEGPPAPHRVVVLVVAGVSLSELGLAGDAFGAAAQAPGAAWPRYEVTVCTDIPGPVNSREGHELHVPVGLAAMNGAGTLVLPGCAPIGAVQAPGVVAAVRNAHAAGARVVATCTGVSLALSAGLLGERTATTHWRQAESLTGAHPEVVLTPEAMYVDHGDVVTGAGTSASVDLYLHLIHHDHGSDVTEYVRRQLVAPRRTDVTGAARDAVTTDRPDPLAGVLDYLAAHLHQREPLAAAAARFGWSERTLRRRFDEQLGTTPGRWSAAQRLTQATHLLETTDLPIEAIARRLGLTSATALRRQFRHELGTTPSTHRTTHR